MFVFHWIILNNSILCIYYMFCFAFYVLAYYSTKWTKFTISLSFGIQWTRTKVLGATLVASMIYIFLFPGSFLLSLSNYTFFGHIISIIISKIVPHIINIQWDNTSVPKSWYHDLCVAPSSSPGGSHILQRWIFKKLKFHIGLVKELMRVCSGGGGAKFFSTDVSYAP